MAATPFTKPPMSMRLSKIVTPAKRPIAADIAIIVADTFAICTSVPIDVTMTSSLRNPMNPAMNAIPFTISPKFK